MSDRLQADQTLDPNQPIYSSNNQYRLIYQDDGNLVMYNENNEPIWASNTDGRPAGRVSMDRDGYLRLYDQNGDNYWTSDYANAGGDEPFLCVQDDGNLVIYVDDQVVWTR